MSVNLLQKVMDEYNVDALLITVPENMRYLTNFSGGEGYLLVCNAHMTLLVDGRYVTEAREEAENCQVVPVEKGVMGLAGWIMSDAIKSIGVEAEAITVSDYQQLVSGLEGVTVAPVVGALTRLRGYKDSREIAHIRRAIQIAETAWSELLPTIMPGITEAALALEFEYLIRKRGAEAVSFDIIVASGPRSALPHAQPTSRRLRDGDFVIFDFGARYAGYHSDQTRTVVLGSPTSAQQLVYETVKQAHDAAIRMTAPGVTMAGIDAAARDHIAEAGFTEYFNHSTGHGVGLAVHEWPVVGRVSQDVAREGMVITVEPGIYIPDEGGVRIEDMVLVTSNGCTVLTTSSTELKAVRS